MIQGHVELHNVAEVQPVAGGGVRLQRVPEAVRAQLNEGAQMRVRQMDNCEIRFVCDGDEVEVTLSSEDACDVALFHGSFDGRRRFALGKEPQTIRVSPADPKLRQLDRRWWADQPFDPAVRRLVFGGRRRDAVILHAVEGRGVRPPAPAQLPRLRYLAYGTSITQGFDCQGPHLSYVGQVAWHLGADLVNLGVGGACHCEPAFADHIAGRGDWDVATLALSVNMQHFAMTEFRQRVGYMVRTVAAANPGKPVVCITLYPFFRDLGVEPEGQAVGGTPEAFRQALRDAVAGAGLANLHLVEGPDLLTDIGGLTDDLIHPSDHAMIQIGRNLAQRIRPLLAGGA